jgi:tRNA U38,U39,U40 pseudouridine synthase TruA
MFSSADAQGSHVYWPVDRNPSTRAECTQELDYVTLLNNDLPSTTRIIGWAPVHRDFNALFEC